MRELVEVDRLEMRIDGAQSYEAVEHARNAIESNHDAAVAEVSETCYEVRISPTRVTEDDAAVVLFRALYFVAGAQGKTLQQLFDEQVAAHPHFFEPDETGAAGR